MKTLILTIGATLAFAGYAQATETEKLNSMKSIEQFVNCSKAIKPAIQYIDYASIDGSNEGSEPLEMPESILIENGTEKDLQNLAWKYRKTLIRQLTAVTAPTVVTAAELNNGRKSVKENFRRGVLSADHPCTQVKDGAIRSAFRNAGDAVVEGFIRFNQKTSGYEKANRTSASN